jgi:hypothetical protein
MNRKAGKNGQTTAKNEKVTGEKAALMMGAACYFTAP